MTARQMRTRYLTIVAQDPGLKLNGKILTERVAVPAECLDRGPLGNRVHVVDYDASTQTLYSPADLEASGAYEDAYLKPSSITILGDPGFHAQNVYAIAMRTLARFESALGRRVGWGFDSHQLKIAPHAFADPNAFYSRADQGLMFGYFPGHSGMVFSCLSHDVVAHETTHALLDGLRVGYMDPSSADQAAFHEAFADLVALLSVFSLKSVVKRVLSRDSGSNLVPASAISKAALKQSVLLGLAEEMGDELGAYRSSQDALRRSVELNPSRGLLNQSEFSEAHRRGEVLVAAVMNAFISVLSHRISQLGTVTGNMLDLNRVAEEAADVADYLLTMVIRAIDYTPPMHINFNDYLSALLTADYEIRPDDSRFHFRNIIRETFTAYGIDPIPTKSAEPGIWDHLESDVTYRGVHFSSMQHDPEEVFRFIWENRQSLNLFEQAGTRITSVRPCSRLSPEGFQLKETVAECVQTLSISVGELKRFKIDVDFPLSAHDEVTLQGGSTLIFDDYGKLKYAIGTRLHNWEKQSERLRLMVDAGCFDRETTALGRISALHTERFMDTHSHRREGWK